ncbi:MAG: hydrolase [Clostridiales Family XIII bacterium]|jgi:calcineurin-like phosphoesterase family protein|nr:hydrolase [Clostridiales Family XIII bacterium]
MIYYIADTHFGHSHIIQYSHRPFADVAEMDRTLIKNWNSRVTDNDDIYILGDLFFRNDYSAEDVLDKLKGKKHLAIGNHDQFLNTIDAEKYFEEVADILEVTDGGNRVILCHYPILVWKASHRGSYHLYGHVHNTKHNCTEAQWNILMGADHAFNAGVDVNGYMPVTFDEVIAYNLAFREQELSPAYV